MFTMRKILMILLTLFPFLMEAVTKEEVPILKCAINRIDKRACKVAICAVFRDEAAYLPEWIEYHRLVGVEHFYLYNNFSQDNFWGILKPYVDQGVVELFDVPLDSYAMQDGAKTHNIVQVACYDHAIALASRVNEWLAIIDVDEFICPVADKNLVKALQRYSYAGGVVVYWQIFGTSNVWDLNPGELMIEKLLYRSPNTGGNGLFKSIVRPSLAECQGPHWTKVRSLPLVLPNHQSFSHTPYFTTLPVDILCINHYTFRTESFYQTIKKPRRMIWGENFSPEQDRERIDFANSVYDPFMLQFVGEIKKRLFGK